MYNKNIYTKRKHSPATVVPSCTSSKAKLIYSKTGPSKQWDFALIKYLFFNLLAYLCHRESLLLKEDGLPKTRTSESKLICIAGNK